MVKERSKPKKLWTIFALVIAVVAITKELQRPSDEREWHGKVGFVPYDFRFPTISRIRDTYWNPDGPIISSQVFGVGWAVNIAALKNLFSR